MRAADLDHVLGGNLGGHRRRGQRSAQQLALTQQRMQPPGHVIEFGSCGALANVDIDAAGAQPLARPRHVFAEAV